MRKTILLLLLLSSASLLYAQSGFSIKRSNVTIAEVIGTIEAQSEYSFFYTDEVDTKKKCTVDIANGTLDAVLKQTFRSTNIQYKVNGHQVVLYVTPPAASIPLKKVNLEQHPENAKPAADKVKNTSSGQPQQPAITVRGAVTDTEGFPLQGATICVKSDRKKYTTTGANGLFELSGVPSDAVLEITFLGFEAVEYPVKGQKEITIQMKSDAVELEQVIVTGYQTVKKEQSTGSVAIAGPDVLERRIVVSGNIATSLEGQLPGVYVDPLNPNELQIRGVSTFNAVKQPLMVIDGFPSELKLSDLNPTDIVNITVLKDAAAAAIYGVRASNGVIVIQTKQGEAGQQFKFSVRANMSVQLKPDLDYLDLLRGEPYVAGSRNIINAKGDKRATYVTRGTKVSNVADVQFDLNDGKISEERANELFAEIAKRDNMQQYSDLFFQNRIGRQVDFDMSGRNGPVGYLVGGSLLSNDPLAKGSNYQKATVSLKGNYTMSKIFTLSASAFYGNHKTTDREIPSYYQLLPDYELVDDAGKALPAYYEPSIWTNAYFTIDPEVNKTLMSMGNNDFNYYPAEEFNLNSLTTSNNNIRLQALLKASITPWLSMEGGGAYEQNHGMQEYLYNKESFFVRDMMNTHGELSASNFFKSWIPDGDILKSMSSKETNYTLRLQANVNKNFGDKHNLVAIAGAEQRETTVESAINTTFGYDRQSMIGLPVNIDKLTTERCRNPFSPLYFMGWPTAAPLTYDTYFGREYIENRFVSFYANAAYTFDRRYVLTGSFRIDQSNLFGTDPKYRYKPLWSVGMSWNISNEKFLSGIRWIDLLKLRASIGFNGNVAKNTGPFVLTSSEADYLAPDYTIYSTVISPRNNQLRWEQTKNYNAGVDMRVLNNRLSLSLDYYYKLSVDVLGDVGSDPTSGFNSLLRNYAELYNEGVEINVESMNMQKGAFQWQTQITASYNKNMVTKVEDSQDFNGTSSIGKVMNYTISEGYPLNGLFSYDYRGLNNRGIPLINVGNGKIVPVYELFSGSIPLSAAMYSGTTIPKYTAGLSNRFTWKGIDLYFMFIFNGGHVMRSPAPLPSDVTLLEGAENFWQKPGDEKHTDVPGFNFLKYENRDSYFSSDAVFAYRYAKQSVRKADYVKLKDITLSYNLPAKWIRKLSLDMVRVQAQFSNLWHYTFSGNDIDPESIDPTTGRKTLPMSPTYSFGLILHF